MTTEKRPDAETGKNPYMEIFAAWEKAMSENMDALFRNPAFLTGMGQIMEHSLTFKEHIDKAIGANLRAMQLPSTRETDQILAEMTALRGELAGLRTQLERLLEPHKAEVQSRKEELKELEKKLAESKSRKEANSG